MGLVLDCSITMALCFEDEQSPTADQAIDAVVENGGWVPGIWWYEVRNVLIVNERRGRIDSVRTAAFLADLAALPIEEDRHADEATVLSVAREYELSVYDAAYLELALRRQLPLATQDRKLADTAQRCGVNQFEKR